MTAIIIFGSLAGIIFISFLAHLAKLNSRKTEFKDWQIGGDNNNTMTAWYHI